MADNSSDNRGLLAGIMATGLVIGLVAFVVMAFVLKYPGFESAPAAIFSWLAALLIVTMLARKA